MVTVELADEIYFDITTDKHPKQIKGSIWVYYEWDENNEETSHIRLNLNDLLEEEDLKDCSRYEYTQNQGEYAQKDGLKLKEIAIEHLPRIKELLGDIVESAFKLK